MTGPFESVSPLPGEIRQAVVALVSIGLVSFVTSCLLFAHITYKLILWKIRDVRNQKKQLERGNDPMPNRDSVDLNMGLVEEHYYQARSKAGTRNESENDSIQASSTQHELHGTRSPEIQNPVSTPASSVYREKPPNPLLLLIYNLLLADMTLSSAYATGMSWLAVDGIIAPSRTCNAQGWLVSVGCLTTSGILFAISVFSYLGIIRGYKPATRDVILACSTIWVLSIILASVGSMHFHDGNFYGRETTWCWISDKHKLWRLSVYLWGFPAMAATMVFYGIIFYKLWREGRSSRFMPRRRRGSEATQVSRFSVNASNSTALRPSGHHPAFLIYPCIYMVTGTPLILGSLIPELEKNPYFMGTAGSLLAMTGVLDTILWSSIILFSKREDLANTGLDQFSFVRTPEGRTLGNIVLVQGGGGFGKEHDQSRQSKKQQTGWWRLGDRNNSRTSISQTWLTDPENGLGIHMDVVTSVVVEQENSRRHAGQQGMSLESFLLKAP